MCSAPYISNFIVAERIDETFKFGCRNHCPFAKRCAYPQVARINLPVDPGFVAPNRGASFGRRVREAGNRIKWNRILRLLNGLLLHVRSRLRPRVKNQLPLWPQRPKRAIWPIAPRRNCRKFLQIFLTLFCLSLLAIHF
jgi:hypothetical protein